MSQTSTGELGEQTCITSNNDNGQTISEFEPSEIVEDLSAKSDNLNALVNTEIYNQGNALVFDQANFQTITGTEETRELVMTSEPTSNASYLLIVENSDGSKQLISAHSIFSQTQEESNLNIFDKIPESANEREETNQEVHEEMLNPTDQGMLLHQNDYNDYSSQVASSGNVQILATDSQTENVFHSVLISTSSTNVLETDSNQDNLKSVSILSLGEKVEVDELTNPPGKNYENSDQNNTIKEATSLKDELSKIEKSRLERFQKELKSLEKSHLQHHRQQLKKKAVVNKIENQTFFESSENESSDEDVGYDSISAQTPIFSEIKAIVNPVVVKEVPGCQQFLLKESQKINSSISFDAEGICMFSGSMDLLVKIYNDLKSVGNLRHESNLSYQQTDLMKRDKGVLCNLLVPFISSYGRHAKISSVGFWNRYQNFDLTVDSKDEIDSDKKRKCRLRRGNKSRTETFETTNEFADSVEPGVDNCIETDLQFPEIDRNVESLERTDESIDPLQKRLREEQLKCKRIVLSQQKKNAELFKWSEKKLRRLDAQLSTTSEGSFEENTQMKKEQIDPLKNDSGGLFQKVKPRNPLGESVQTKIQRLHEENISFKYFCKHCSFKSKRPSHYFSHVKLHQKNRKIHQCKKCEFRTISMTMLRRHELTHTKSILTCDICNVYTTDQQVLLNKHKQLKHFNKKDIMQIMCPFCNQVFNSKQALGRHRNGCKLNTEKSGTEYKCTQCNKVFKKTIHLSRHVRDVHGPGSRPHLCQTCGKAFKRSDALQQHQMVHLDVSARKLPFKCNTCEKAFRSQSHLKEHLARHTTERPFLCQFCGAAFKTRPVQKHHIHTLHVKPRAHVCAICSRQFNSKSALQKHENSHKKNENELLDKDVPEQSNKMEDKNLSESLHLTEDTTAAITIENQTVVLSNQAEACLVHDIMANSGEQLDAVDSNFQQTLIHNQQPGSLYYFAEDIQNLHNSQ